jgi:hypothetical protein
MSFEWKLLVLGLLIATTFCFVQIVWFGFQMRRHAPDWGDSLHDHKRASTRFFWWLGGTLIVLVGMRHIPYFNAQPVSMWLLVLHLFFAFLFLICIIVQKWVVTGEKNPRLHRELAKGSMFFGAFAAATGLLMLRLM